MYIYMSRFMRVCMHAYVYIYIYIYIPTHMYVRIYIYMYKYMCVYWCVYIYIYICVCVCVCSMHHYMVSLAFVYDVKPVWLKCFAGLPNFVPSCPCCQSALRGVFRLLESVGAQVAYSNHLRLLLDSSPSVAESTEAVYHTYTYICLYIYMYMHIHMFIYVYTQLYMYIYIDIRYYKISYIQYTHLNVYVYTSAACIQYDND